MKYLSIDVETTGLDSTTHELLEIGMVLDDLNEEIPIANLPTFHCYIAKPGYFGDPFALSMHPTILRRIANFNAKRLTVEDAKYRYLSPECVVTVITEWLDKNINPKCDDDCKITPAGKNFASFDRQFLAKLPGIMEHGSELAFRGFVPRSTEDQNPAHVEMKFSLRHRALDPTAYFTSLKDEKPPDLNTCCQRAFGTQEKVVTHTALEDAFLVVRLLREAKRQSRFWG